MTDWTFHPELVAPFYLDLMGGNLARMPLDDRLTLLRLFRQRAEKVTDARCWRCCDPLGDPRRLQHGSSPVWVA
jgi:hypothetical protein